MPRGTTHTIVGRGVDAREAVGNLAEVIIVALCLKAVVALDGAQEVFHRQAKLLRQLLEGVGLDDIAILNQLLDSLPSALKRPVGRCTVVKQLQAAASEHFEAVDILRERGIPDVAIGVVLLELHGVGQGLVEEKGRIHAGRFDDYDMRRLWDDNEDIRSLKSLILFGIKGMAAYAYHAFILGKTDDEVNRFFYDALYAIGEQKSPDELLALVLKTGEVNLKCMAMLDAANTEAYGDPVPTQVPLTVEKGPFIVVSGHDLHDLKLLLDQTEGKGINIYTHSEMLPAHGYPKLKSTRT